MAEPGRRRRALFGAVTALLSGLALEGAGALPASIRWALSIALLPYLLGGLLIVALALAAWLRRVPGLSAR